MRVIIAQRTGRVHHAAGNPNLQITRPTYAFVPEEFFSKTGLDMSRYLASRWPSINCGANPNGTGSHVLPNPAKTANIRSRCRVLRKFLTRLETIASSKAVTNA
jgi:hypothetical protein